jgi:hypothetical protein
MLELVICRFDESTSQCYFQLATDIFGFMCIHGRAVPGLQDVVILAVKSSQLLLLHLITALRLLFNAHATSTWHLFKTKRMRRVWAVSSW